jgi:hypothetical protein
VQGNPKLDMPWLAVDDPEDGERPPNSRERRQLARSIALGHFAAMAEGLGASGTSSALQQAKGARPGNLRLPQEELLQVERKDAPIKIALGAAVTSSGIIPMPREGNLEEFRSALATVYGDKAMLLTIDVEILKKIDAGTIPVEAGQPSEPKGEPSFWLEERQYSDQTELTPLGLVTLLRPPPLDQIKSH